MKKERILHRFSSSNFFIFTLPILFFYFRFFFSFFLFFFCTTDIFLNPFGKPRYSRCYQAFWRIRIAFLVTEKHWNIGEYWYKMSWISFFVQTFFVQKVNLSYKCGSRFHYFSIHPVNTQPVLDVQKTIIWYSGRHKNVICKLKVDS